MATDPTTMTPVEIDTVLYENYTEQARNEATIVSTVKQLERMEKRFNSRLNDTYLRDQILVERDALIRLQVRRSELVLDASPFQAEYISRPWNRYFLVQNSNGHVHRGMDCYTCFRDTVYTWLVNLADCDEDAMIEEWGERACTVCFPSAPTNPLFNRPARVDREAQAARADEKATKDAAKAEKAITDVDGSPLKIGREVYATKVSARNELSRRVQNAAWYGPDAEDIAAITKLSAALEAAGIDWKLVTQRAVKKVVKDAVMDPSNPYRLTPEQIAETEAKHARNTEATREVLKGLGVTV